MSGRRDRGTKNPLESISLFSQHTVENILQLPPMLNHREIRPKLYAGEEYALAGFVDVKEFRDVTFNTISKSNLGWVENPDLFNVLGFGEVTYRGSRFLNLFAKHELSEAYFYLGVPAELIVDFSSSWVLPSDLRDFTMTTIHLASSLNEKTVISLKGGEWLLKIDYQDKKALNSRELLNVMEKMFVEYSNVMIVMDVERYDGFAIHIRIFGDRSSIYINHGKRFRGQVIDESIPDNRARLAKHQTREVAYELRRTVSTPIALQVAVDLVETGEKPTYVKWEF